MARHCRYHIKNAVVAGHSRKCGNCRRLWRASGIWHILVFLGTVVIQKNIYLQPDSGRTRRVAKSEPWHVNAPRATSGIRELEEQCYAGNSLVAAKTPRKYPIIPRAPRHLDLSAPRQSFLLILRASCLHLRVLDASSVPPDPHFCLAQDLPVRSALPPCTDSDLSTLLHAAHSFDSEPAIGTKTSL